MIYKSYSNLIFGNVNLSDYDSFSFYCDQFEKPVRSMDIVEVPGMNGSLLFDNGRYDNSKRSYQIQAVGLENIHRLQAALLSVTGYARLEDDYEPEVYMMARIADEIIVDRFVGDAVSMGLTVDRKPQKWLKSGEMSREFTSAGTIYNPTLYAAKPLVRAYGEGTVSIGSETITITDADEYTDIDCELQDAFKGTTNCNGNIQLTSGNFFSLNPGTNNIAMTGVTRVIITPRWWSL